MQRGTARGAMEPPAMSYRQTLRGVVLLKGVATPPLTAALNAADRLPGGPMTKKTPPWLSISSARTNSKPNSMLKRRRAGASSRRRAARSLRRMSCHGTPRRKNGDSWMRCLARTSPAVRAYSWKSSISSKMESHRWLRVRSRRL